MRISDWSFRRVLFRSRALAARGMLEAVTYSFTDGRFAGLFSGGDLKLANPISAELDVMRPSILPNLLMAARRNADRGFARSEERRVGNGCVSKCRSRGEP